MYHNNDNRKQQIPVAMKPKENNMNHFKSKQKLEDGMISSITTSHEYMSSPDMSVGVSGDSGSSIACAVANFALAHASLVSIDRMHEVFDPILIPGKRLDSRSSCACIS
jgi:hypothetical protein